MAMELGNMAQDHKATNTPGTNTDFFHDHDEIKRTPIDGRSHMHVS